MATVTGVKERPILFSGPMVRAILAGNKTQTRRTFKLPTRCSWYDELGGEAKGWFTDAKHPEGWWHVEELGNGSACPYGEPGDRLWVRETWLEFRQEHWSNFSKPRRALLHDYGTPRVNSIAYAAECEPGSDRCRLELGYPKWRPSIFMPRWASRLTLEVTETRVERLHDITEIDAALEGAFTVPDDVIQDACRAATPGASVGPVDYFRHLWFRINGKQSWDANPFVWVVSFKRVEFPRPSINANAKTPVI